VLAHLRDVAHLLDGPLPVIRRQRLAVAGHLAGLAGSLAFDLRQESKAIAYFAVALQAAGDANSPDLRFGPCHPVDEATKAAGRCRGCCARWCEPNRSAAGQAAGQRVAPARAASCLAALVAGNEPGRI
jgi:hypothetical protein